MQEIEYGKTGIRTARLGLGCMRLPADQKKVDEVVRYAIDNGVNYLDTAYFYKDNEVRVGKALKGGYREKAILATKSPVWEIKEHSDFERLLDIELARLNTDYIDVYLMHGLGYDQYEMVKKYDGFSFLDRMIDKGKILHKGFSYHGPNSLFRKIVDGFDWEMAQIQLNILDEFEQAGVDGLKYAHAKGMATVIMEPLRGGHLINDHPPEIDGLIDDFPERRSLVEWAFRWVCNFREADLILSGMQTVEQVRQNIAIFDRTCCNCMTSEEMELIEGIRKIFEKRNAVGCTGCGYCMPCPSGVDIPEVFKYYNKVSMLEKHWVDKSTYLGDVMGRGRGADKCTRCGACEPMCPQGIKIPDELEKAQEVLTAK